MSVTVADPGSIELIFFYINLGLMLCAVIQMTALIVLCRKTSCASVIGSATAMVFGMGIVVFFVQLLMHVYNNPKAMYVITFCTCILYLAFIMSCVYSILLSRNSRKGLCIATGVLDIIPPIGAVLTIILSYKIKRDTPMQEYVYNGYAYTYAALGQFCAKNKPMLIDMSGAEEFEQLTKRERKRKIKELKRNRSTPEGKYAYAAALTTYKPVNTKKAVKYMKKAADGGYAPALFNMGYYYEIGAYVKKDLKRAKSLYSRAAQAGDEDAALRLGILDIKSGDRKAGLQLFTDRAENKNDVCARYDMGICYELGWGVDADIDKALEIYMDCVKKGMFAAQKRIFAIASTDINSAQNGDFFRKVTDRKFTGTFKIMIDGLIEIKKRHAADAADKFLKAVKKHDKWEGFARCLVGTLYIDCGKELEDKCNGAEYIKSAMDMMPEAKSMYSVVPAAILKEIKARTKSEKNKSNEQKQ